MDAELSSMLYEKCFFFFSFFSFFFFFFFFLFCRVDHLNYVAEALMNFIKVVVLSFFKKQSITSKEDTS